MRDGVWENVTDPKNGDETASRQEPTGVTTAPDEGPRRALVVDDDDEAREYLRDLLSLCGIDVEVAADAEGARALVARRVPDIMLIDIMMPREDGASLLRGLRKRDVGVPAHFVTARSGDAPDEYARELDAGVVRKPFRASELLEAVTNALTRPPS